MEGREGWSRTTPRVGGPGAVEPLLRCESPLPLFGALQVQRQVLVLGKSVTLTCRVTLGKSVPLSGP